MLRVPYPAPLPVDGPPELGSVVQRILTQSELADSLDLDVRQIRNLQKKGLPRLADGKFPWPECLHWYLDFKLAERKTTSAEARREEAEATRAEAMAEKATLELRVQQGSLIPLDWMDEQVSGILSRLRRVLLALPTTWAPQLVDCATPADVILRLEAPIEDALRALQRHAPPDPADDDGEDAGDDSPESPYKTDPAGAAVSGG